VRYVLVDEAGTSAREPVTIVVGLVAHADEHMMLAEAAINEALGAVPEEFRQDFVFHAAEIWSSPKYRSRWSMADRLALLHSMMRLPRRLGIAISLGMVRRDSPSPQEALDHLRLDPVRYQHLMAFMYCIAAADRYIRDYADLREVATVVAEDVPNMRFYLRQVPKALRDHPIVLFPGMLTPTAAEKAAGYIRQTGDFRVSRIRQAIHFANKQEEPLLQLADACAFGLRRYFAEQSMGKEFVRSILGGEPSLEDYRGPAASDNFFGHPPK
jgi:hypothetical protein